MCHSLSSSSVVKSQNTRLTLRTAWHLPAASGLGQGVEQLPPPPCGQLQSPWPAVGCPWTTSLCRAAPPQPCLKGAHACSWLIPPPGCPHLAIPILPRLQRTPLMDSSSLTCFCSPFSRCCMQNFACIYVCEA